MTDSKAAPEQEPSTAPAAPEAPAPAASAELVRERFEAVAARQGVDEGTAELLSTMFGHWLTSNGKAGAKADAVEFLASLKEKAPKLFGQPAAQPAARPNTAPVQAGDAPAAPQPASVMNPYSQWRALVEAGAKAEAEAFYQRHRRSIARLA